MCEGVEGEWQMNCVVSVKWQCGLSFLCKRATSVAHLTNFSFDFFMKFLQKMPVRFDTILFRYDGAKSQK